MTGQSKGPGEIPVSARWWISFAIWTTIGLLFILQSFIFSTTAGRSFDWTNAFLYQLSHYWVWAALTPLLVKLAERFPFTGPRAVRHAIVHLGAALLLAPLQRALALVGYSAMVHLLVDSAQQILGLIRPQVVLNGALNGFLLYWVVVGLFSGFQFYSRYRRHQLRTLDLERQLARAQLQALKMQLHPHFLFNTLNTISAMVEENPKDAQRMISRLSDLLRITLENAGTQRVPLSEEIEFLRVYLQIEQTRFQERLELEFRLGPTTLEVLVPNLILQPLVENSIRHAVASRIAPVRVEVCSESVNGRLRLSVRDNGPGVTPGQDPFADGLGLNNTRARLSQMYGSDHCLELVTPERGGLEVRLEIPVQPAGNEAS